MLSAVLFSSALGLSYVVMNAGSPEYVAKATVTFVGPEQVTIADSATVVPIAVYSIPSYSQRAEMDALDKDLTKIITYTRTPVEVTRYSVVRRGTSPSWLQSVALGSVLALLAVVGSVYVWEDAKAYRRQLTVIPNPG